MDSSAQDVQTLIYQATRLAYGSAERRTLLDQAIAVAERADALRDQFDARYERMETAVFGGEDDVAMAMFAWCQRTADDRPDVIEPHEMLWSYKYAMGMLPKFARIPQASIDRIAADMEQRYRANNVSMRPVHAVRSLLAMFQGRIAEARTLWNEAQRHRRDRYADCPACELNTSIGLLALEGRHAEVITNAAPILAGTVACATVPHATLPEVIRAHQALGQHDAAQKLLGRAYGMIKDNPDFIEEVAHLIEYATDAGNYQFAADTAARHLPWLKIVSDDMMQERYARAVARLLYALPDDGAPQERLWQALAEAYGVVNVPASTGNATRPASQRIREHLISHGTALAAKLDQRNGNAFYGNKWRMLAR